MKPLLVNSVPRSKWYFILLQLFNFKYLIKYLRVWRSEESVE